MMLNQKSLLFVSNEVVSRSALAKQFLHTTKFSRFEFDDINVAINHVKSNRTSAILIDADCLKINHTKVSKRILGQGILTPLVFLIKSSSHPANIIIHASDKVAYSLVTKPFRFVQLAAHVKSVVARFEQTDAATVQLAHFIFRPAQKTLTDSNHSTITLTDKESDILEFLLDATDHTASRPLMLESVWGYSPEADTHTIDTHVYKLRQKIEPDPNNPTLLVSVNGGFRLNALSG